MNLSTYKWKFWLGILLLSIISCSQQASSTKDATAQKLSEEEVINQLAADLIANPQTQQQIDQNSIVNYAIDNGLAVKRTPTGIYYQIIEAGEGGHPTVSSKLVADYKGSLLDGKVFDSSYSRGEPLQFQLKQMIPGWQEVIPMLQPGGKAILLVPSHLAYGQRGYPGLIPPNSALRFDVELISFE